MQFEQLGVDKADQGNLQRLANLPEWTSLLKLFRGLERGATEHLIGFQSAEEAFERRGYIKGMRAGLEAVESIYASTHGVNDVPSEHGSAPERRRSIADSAGIRSFFSADADAINPADASPSGPSY